MYWVIGQAIIFGLLIFLPISGQFDLPDWARLVMRIANIAGFIILFKAMYDLRRSLSVAPAPVKNGQLQTRGIYRIIRHPMYLAVWLIFGADVLRSGSLVKIGIFVGLVAFFVFKTRHEESLLKKKYPGYDKYMKRVGAFFPVRRTRTKNEG